VYLQEYEDVRQLKSLIQRHLKFTGSQVARQILLNWDKERTKFIKVRLLAVLGGVWLAAVSVACELRRVTAQCVPRFNTPV
jgi:hypothetical protein